MSAKDNLAAAFKPKLPSEKEANAASLEAKFKPKAPRATMSGIKTLAGDHVRRKTMGELETHAGADPEMVAAYGTACCFILMRVLQVVVVYVGNWLPCPNSWSESYNLFLLSSP
jgi:hypothetical protein